MTVLDPSPFVKHIFRFRIFGVGRAIGIDIRPDVGEEMNPIARLYDGSTNAGELSAVVGQNFAVPTQVVLFQRRSCKSRFGVKEVGQLGYQIFSLDFISL